MNKLRKFNCLASRFQYALLSALLICGAGCSNPLSSSKSDSLQSFHSENVNCDEVNFSAATFSVDRIRQLSHCLNSNQEISALDKLLIALPDSDLQPVADFANVIISQQPKYLFALKETYDRAKNTGELSSLEQTVATLFADTAKNAALVAVLKKVSTPLTTFMFDANLHGSLTNLYTILRSKSFQRMGVESFQNDNLDKFLIATNHYLKSPDATSVSKLYGFLSDNALDARWKTMVAKVSDEQTHVQNIAHFFEWLVSNGNYPLLSTGVHEMITEPVVCFAGGRIVPDSLTSIATQLSKMTSAQARTYFTHDIKNLYTVSLAYCKYPYSASAVLKMVDEATRVQGFDEIFELVKPIFADPNFIAFIGSSASKQFMTDLGPLVGTHFFEDLFTITTLHLQNPLTSDGTKLATLIDESFKSITDTDIKPVLNFLAPLFTTQQGFGFNITKTFYQMGYGLPELAPVLDNSMRAGMTQTVRDIIWQAQFSSVLDLGAKLIDETKLNGLIDQALTYLNEVFQRGVFAYQPPTAQDPSNASMPSEIYLLEKLVGGLPTVTPCDSLNDDWVFSQYTATDSASYLKQISAIQACVDTNQTFVSAKDLITYSIDNSEYAWLMATQTTVINTFFKTDLNLSIQTLNDFLAVGPADSNTIGSALDLASSTFGLIKSSYLTKNDLRKSLADVAADPTVYNAVAELTAPEPARLRSSDPTLDIRNLKSVNAMVDRTTTLNQVPVADALSAMMKEYCPSLDNTKEDCTIDQDQVVLYKQSPILLFQKIASEELQSAQSFLHPVLNAAGWIHQSKSPSQVSMFEYHLNPLLHLFRQQPQSPQSLLTTISRTAADGMPLNTFLSDRASRLILIPYIYEVPTFPGKSAREYHDHIRIRILNDLDRLELIALNSDFKAFGIVSNIGMGMLRQVALAWGDVPVEKRPASLSKFVKPEKVQTLKQVQESILASMQKYDSTLLQSLGACDPQAHDPILRWLISGACNQLSDVSARIFNLRFLISLLQDELPEANGGHGGLVFLRDMFYSFYEANSDAQRGDFVNGERVNANCLENPLTFDAPLPECQLDLLTTISRVAHLGLLHEAGVSILAAKDNPIPATTSIIDRVVANPDLSKSFVTSLSSDAGVKFFTNGVDYGFQSPDGTGKNLSVFSQLASIPTDLSWMNLLFEMIPKDPDFTAQNQAFLNALLSINAETLKPWLDQWLANPKLPTPQFLNFYSQKMTPAVRNDILTLLVELTPNSEKLADDIASAKKLPDLNANALKIDVNAWAKRFADPSLAKTRSDFSNWTISSDFTQFCDVFSDSTWITKAYNFLESVNQNPDSKTFLQNCQDFLTAH